MKASIALSVHMHRSHAETIRNLAGALDFHIDRDWHAATGRTCIHIPPGAPHACAARPDTPGRMQMICQPTGFDQVLAEMTQTTEADLAGAAKMAVLNEKHDIVPLGGAPDRA